MFCPKYRHNIFKDQLEYEISKMFKNIAFNYCFEILEQEIMPDHVHFFTSASNLKLTFTACAIYNTPFLIIL